MLMIEIIAYMSVFFFVLGITLFMISLIIYGNRDPQTDMENIIFSLSSGFTLFGISLSFIVCTFSAIDSVKIDTELSHFSPLKINSENMASAIRLAKTDKIMQGIIGFSISFIIFICSMIMFYRTIDSNNSTSRQFKLFLKWLGKKTIPSIVSSMIVAWF